MNMLGVDLVQSVVPLRRTIDQVKTFEREFDMVIVTRIFNVGHSSVSQINDDQRVHGACKQYVRKRAGQSFLTEASRGAEQKQSFKMGKIKLDDLYTWLGEWLDLMTEECLFKIC